MATKSALKTVYIKDAKSAARLVSALEHAKDKKATEITLSRAVSTATREDIRKIFKTNDGV